MEVVDAAAAEDAQRRAAGTLAARGMQAGDRVAFCLSSSVALLTGILGALRTGIVPVILNPSLLTQERRLLLEDADVALLIDDDSALAALGEGPPAELAPYPLARPMHYTSGTTGRPKGVWSGVLDPAAAQALFEDEADVWAFDGGDTHLVCSPMHHSVSIRFAAGTLLRGGRLVVLSRFDAATAVDALTRYSPTTTFMAPTALQRVLAHGVDASQLASLRLLVHAGSPCPPALKHAALALVGDGVLWEFYGSTEGQFTVCSPDEWLEHPGTVGRARPRRSLHLDDGVVWCRCPSFARFSYWGDPDATAQAWRDDAFSVGDLGHLDADGYLYLDARRDDLIITGGVNVYPAEVEAALVELTGVVEVGVFAREDPHWGQRVCAAVVGDVDETALRTHAAARLAPYKRPKEYFGLDALPRTDTGKLRRRELPAALGLTGSAAGSGPGASGE